MWRSSAIYWARSSDSRGWPATRGREWRTNSMGLTWLCVGRFDRFFLVAALLPFGCGGSDGFEPPQAAAGSASTASEPSLRESVIEACTDLCVVQLERSCSIHSISTAQCANYCSFLGAVEATCQQATDTAFRCQLSNDPCGTTRCNELLRAAEEVCPVLD